MGKGSGSIGKTETVILEKCAHAPIYESASTNSTRRR